LHHKGIGRGGGRTLSQQREEEGGEITDRGEVSSTNEGEGRAALLLGERRGMGGAKMQYM